MKKITVYAMVLATSISCLTGCGSEKNIKSVSMAPCDPPEEVEAKCYHEHTDSTGICLDCGEDAGVAIGSEEFYAYFDILMQPRRGYTNGFDIVVAPRNGYENATFENVCVTVYGTKLDHDGFTRNRNCQLVSIDLDEKGTGTFSGFIEDYVSVDYVEVSPSEHYWGCKFTNCHAIIQGYLGTQFKDIGYVDINERGFGRAEWYGLTDEEQKEIQIEKVYINPGPFGEEVPMVDLDDTVSDVEAWMPKTETIEIGKYDFDKYFNPELPTFYIYVGATTPIIS